MGINLSQDSAIQLLGKYPKVAQPYYKNNCSTMFIAASFVVAKTEKQPRCPSTKEWTKKIWFSYTMEHYSEVYVIDGTRKNHPE